MNIYDYKIPQIKEDFTTLFKNRSVEVVRIVSSDILEDKLYIQDVEEFVILLEGEATIEIFNKEITLKRGDTLHIPPKEPHRVLKTKKGTLWLAIYIKV